MTMPAGGVIPCPVLIRQDPTGCVDVLALTLRGLMSGMPMPTTFPSPAEIRKQIGLSKFAFYKFPNVKNEFPIHWQDAIDADIKKASVNCASVHCLVPDGCLLLL